MALRGKAIEAPPDDFAIQEQNQMLEARVDTSLI